MYLKIVHSGLTAEQVLALPDDEKGQLFLEGLLPNCCAGAFPYEQDFIPCISLSLEEGLCIAPLGTEDMVGAFLYSASSRAALIFFFLAQGWPCTESPMNGRVMRKLRPIKVSQSMTMPELLALFKQPPMTDRSSFRSLNPDIAFVPQVPVDAGALPELCLGMAFDDCESSTLTGMVMKKTSLHLFDTLNRLHDPAKETRGQLLRRLSEDGWPVFKQFTDRSWELMARVLDAGNGMLKAGYMRSMTAVGLSTSASAADVRDKKAKFGGHCFAVSCIKTPAMARASVGLLEGTAPTIMVRAREADPGVPVPVFREGVAEPTTRVVKRTELLDLLGGALLRLTRLLNCPNGGHKDMEGGLAVDVKLRGWLSKTMVVNALDSDASQPLEFYHRVMYMGWPVLPGSVGCMPVEESVVRQAGCHPYRLVDQEVRGVSAAFSPEAWRRMGELMDELTPPMAPHDRLRDLMSMYLPCRPLEAVNADAARRPGVRYHRVCAMESPCAPEYLSVMFEIKRRIAEKANELNEKDPNSDGIRLYALLECLSVTLAADVPETGFARLTVVDNLKRAMAALGVQAGPPRQNKA